MELKRMLVGLEGLKVKGDLSVDIKGVERNSKEVKEGYLFVAIKGFSVDGHQFVKDAIANGAVAVMIEEGCDYKKLEIPDNSFFFCSSLQFAIAVLIPSKYSPKV